MKSTLCFWTIVYIYVLSAFKIIENSEVLSVAAREADICIMPLLEIWTIWFEFWL